MMRKIISLLFVVCISFVSNAQQTLFEKSGGTQSASYDQTISFYHLLDRTGDMVFMKKGGMTDAGIPLNIVLVSADKKFDPVKWHAQQKVVIMINNGIHPGEPDGIDASMMMVRDIVNHKIILPSNVVLAIIPVYNIGGALNRNSSTRVNQNGPVEYGFRGNSQNLDLNRDFTKNDSREAMAFAVIFHWLNPDIFIDNHVSDGADYQHTMTLITTQYDKLGPVSGPWLRDVFEPQIYAAMKEKNWDLIPYVEFDGADFKKGIDMFYETPRYSSGYAALFGTFSFIPETHMLKPYAQRVQSTYDLMKCFIERSSANSTALLTKRKEALAMMRSQTTFPLKWSIDRNSNTEITFKGYEQDTALSEATGLAKMFYNHNKAYTRQIKYFNKFNPSVTVEKPRAYIIPAGWHEVIDRLKLNDVIVKPFEHDTTINVAVYTIEDYKSRTSPYEKHYMHYATKVKKNMQAIKILKGDYLVEVEGNAARYIIEMLEPTGDDSFFAWNFFDGILQQKEGYSDYRWEDIAAQVLKNDPELKDKLEEKKKAEPAFAANSGAILSYIYKNSSWMEKSFMRYPVYRLE